MNEVNNFASVNFGHAPLGIFLGSKTKCLDFPQCPQITDAQLLTSKRWPASPSTLHRCSLTTMAQYQTINHFEHNTRIAHLKSAYPIQSTNDIATRISSPSFVQVTGRQLAASYCLQEFLAILRGILCDSSIIYLMTSLNRCTRRKLKSKIWAYSNFALVSCGCVQLS